MKNWQWIWVLASFFCVSETAHYGWNWVSHSDAEMICDGITFLVYAVGLAARAVENRPAVSIHNH